jgi:hypothetical protein
MVDNSIGSHPGVRNDAMTMSRGGGISIELDVDSAREAHTLT